MGASEMDTFIYKCIECGREYKRDAVRYLCSDCGKLSQSGQPLRGVLETRFDIDSIKNRMNRSHPDWSLLCAVEPEFHPAFPVGNTPYFKAAYLGKTLGFPNLYIKNDSLNPSGSLKDRASELMVAEANRLGEDTVVTASTGNAAAALAAACAAAQKKAIIFVPAAAPKAKLMQMLVHGAKVIRVIGTYDDAFRLSMEYTDKRVGLNRNTAYHPLTIEGKKTVALEIFAQHGMTAPDVILIPVGDGVILSAVYKGFRDLMELGWIDKLPRLIAVQSESSDAIHHFVHSGEYRNAKSPNTIADSISVSAPSNAIMTKRAIEESKGTSVLVSDDEIRAAQYQLAKTTGIFAEPAAAATLAGLMKCNESDINAKESVVLLISGHGLKNVEAIQNLMVIPEPIAPSMDAVDAELSR
jgi:threonine synthase